MYYGDEYYIEVPQGLELEDTPGSRLEQLFVNAQKLTQFSATPDHHAIHDRATDRFDGLLSYRISKDRLIDINEVIPRARLVVRNEVADIISFQFVSTVKRAEYLGDRKHVHNLGPALIVSVIPAKEITYRLPTPNVQIRHVVVHATLSNLIKQVGEDLTAYPGWLQECITGKDSKPRQRVFFLEDVQRDSIWSCFHIPVSGTLLRHWISAKYDELLCVGLQILKNSGSHAETPVVDTDLPYSKKIHRARTLLSMEYANPPPLPKLAQQLGISETRLKSGFKSMFGTTIMQYCIHQRIEAAKLLLADNRLSIADIGNIVGYEDHSAFSRAFRRACGQTPKGWRQSAQGLGKPEP